MKKKSSIDRVKEVCADLEQVITKKILCVDIQAQTMSLYENFIFDREWRVSTSRFGIGNKENSYMTPLGLHRIEEKIGDGAELYSIFRSRINTGEICDMKTDEENLILTRILRLRGLEEGVNVGEGIDSYDRYIYIHGTSREDLIGQPMSHGCVCMCNEDIINLYDLVEVGTLVYIYNE